MYNLQMDDLPYSIDRTQTEWVRAQTFLVNNETDDIDNKIDDSKGEAEFRQLQEQINTDLNDMLSIDRIPEFFLDEKSLNVQGLMNDMKETQFEHIKEVRESREDIEKRIKEIMSNTEH